MDIGLISTFTAAVIILSVLVFTVLYTLIFRFLKSGREARTRYIHHLETASRASLAINYKTCLSRISNKLNYRLQIRHFSFASLIFTTGTAFLYTTGFFLLLWIVYGVSRIGNTAVLPAFANVYQRILFLGIILLIAIIVLKFKDIDRWVQKRYIRAESDRTAYLVYRFAFLVICLILLVPFKFSAADSLFVLAGGIISPVLTLSVSAAVAVIVYFGYHVWTLAVLGILIGILVSVKIFFKIKIETFITAAVAVVAACIIGLASDSIYGYAAYGAEVLAGGIAVGIAGAGSLAILFTMFDLFDKTFSKYTMNIVLLFLFFSCFSIFSDFFHLNRHMAAFLFLITVLPVINGLMDHLSLGKSRFLAMKITETDRFITAAMLFFCDLCLAVLLAALLIFLGTFITELFNIFLARNSDLMIRVPYLVENAFSGRITENGIWLSVMLFTVLVPTVFYAVVLIFTLLFDKATPKRLKKMMTERLLDIPADYNIRPPALYFSMAGTASFLLGTGGCAALVFAVERYLFNFSGPVTWIVKQAILSVHWLAVYPAPFTVL